MCQEVRRRNYFPKNNEKDKGCGGGVRTTKDPRWGTGKVEELGKDGLMKCWQRRAGLEEEKRQQVWMGECKRGKGQVSGERQIKLDRLWKTA